MNDASRPARTPRQRSPFDRILGHQYTVFDGLAGMQVEDIYQDQRGLLWIATADGGVSRFDGAHFDTFGLSDGLPSLTVMSIAEDQDGRLLFGTLGGGIAAYDGRGFQVYTTEHGLPSNDIMSLQPQADGSMRVLTDAGIGWFVEGRCVECVTEIAGQPLGWVYDMVTDTTGTTWLATLMRGVISLDGRRMSAKNGAMQWPWKFAQDASGPLWIAFRYVGTEAVIGRYDPDSQQLDLIKADAAIEGTEAVNHGTRHVRLDDKGRLWMTRQGVLVYDGKEWHSFSAGLPDVHFSEARLTYEDREGNIWVGLWGGGLVFCDPVSVQLYTGADGLPDRGVHQLSEDHQGRIWIGTMGGLACLEDGRIRSVETGHKVSDYTPPRNIDPLVPHQFSYFIRAAAPDPTDATELVDSSTAQVSLMALPGSLIQDVVLSPVFTPNGDGINNELLVHFVLLKVQGTGGTSVRRCILRFRWALGRSRGGLGGWWQGRDAGVCVGWAEYGWSDCAAGDLSLSDQTRSRRSSQQIDATRSRGLLTKAAVPPFDLGGKLCTALS